MTGDVQVPTGEATGSRCYYMSDLANERIGGGLGLQLELTADNSHVPNHKHESHDGCFWVSDSRNDTDHVDRARHNVEYDIRAPARQLEESQQTIECIWLKCPLANRFK